MDFKAYVRNHLPPLVIDREPEVVDELAQHLSDLYAEGRSLGLDHEPAIARAVEALPRHSSEFARLLETSTRALPGLIADRWRAKDDGLPLADRWSWWSVFADLRRDTRYAFRMLARTPGFTFVVVLTLALGIGANAVIFSAVDAVLLRAAPVANADSVISVYTTSSDGRDPYSTSCFPDYMDLKSAGIFQDLAAFASIPLVLDSGGVTESLPGELVTGNYFDVLGVRIAPGRTFSPDEDRPGSPQRVVIISHDAWTRRFNADPSAVGRSISLNGQSYMIIGVAPEGFTSPLLGRSPEMWVPSALQPELRPPSAGLRRSLGTANMLDQRGPRWLNMVGRLAPQSTIATAAGAANVVAGRLEAAYPQSNRGRRFTIVPVGEGPGVRASARPMLRLLMGAVVLVLLIACANVANLMLVRAATRRREVAVRLAVGAGRPRLIRQWLTESLLLALAGAGVGVLFAIWGAPALQQLGIPSTVDVSVNPRVLLFAIVTAVGCGVLFGLAPVIQTLRKDTVAALRDEGGAVASGARGVKLRSAFVVLQVALSLMLLVGAGLFVRTLHNAATVSLGYDIDRMLTGYINLDVRGYTPDRGQLAYAQILERVRALPGVRRAAAARVTVLSGGARTTTVSADGQPVAADGSNGFDSRANVITEGYFDVLRIPLLRGRDFSAADKAGSPPVTIVSSKLAERLHPGLDPIGRTITVGRTVYQIVGVVPDTVYRNTLEQNAPPVLYVPLTQNYESGLALHIATEGDPSDVIPGVRHAVRQVDSQLVLERPTTFPELFAQSIGDQRMMATLVGLFGLVALLLAAVGLYGVMAQMASQRTAEIGIRLALGALPSSIMRLMLGDGLRLVAIGAVLGLAGAFAGVRYVRNQLFGVEPTDPATFVAVCTVLLLVGLVACVVPARRAMRVNPSSALRAT